MQQFQVEYRKIIPSGFLVQHFVAVALDLPRATAQFWSYVDRHITRCPVHLMDVINLTELGCELPLEEV